MFVSVKVFSRLAAPLPPIGAFPKLYVAPSLQERIAGSVPVTPMPFAVVDAVPPKVQARERVAVREPDAAGSARTVTVQVPPPEARFAVPQPFAVIVKSPAFVPEITALEQPVAVAVPEFVKVKTSVVDCAPTMTEPKE